MVCGIFFICIAIFFIIWLKEIIRQRNFDMPEDILVLIIWVLISCGATFITSAVAPHICPTHYESANKYILMSVADNYYASGIINNKGELNYTVMIETEKGFEARCIEASKTTVAYGEGKPVLIQEKFQYDYSFLNWFLDRSFIPDRYSLYVPEGSINMKFNIDLQ